MIYLSRLVLNRRSQTVRRDVSDCQELHRTVLSAFPTVSNNDEGARAAFGILYRVEADARGVQLLVQSNREPDWSALPPGYLASAGSAPNPACKRVDDAYARLVEGDLLLFRLHANPTKRIGNSGNPAWRGKRVELRREDDLLDWLARKGDQGGFRPVAVRASMAASIDPGGATRSTGVEGGADRHSPMVPDVVAARGPSLVSGRRTGRRLTFGSVVYQGKLRVTNAAQFRATLESGVGSGKAYGFGLLSIAPTPTGDDVA